MKRPGRWLPAAGAVLLLVLMAGAWWLRPAARLPEPLVVAAPPPAPGASPPPGAAPQAAPAQPEPATVLAGGCAEPTPGAQAQAVAWLRQATGPEAPAAAWLHEAVSHAVPVNACPGADCDEAAERRRLDARDRAVAALAEAARLTPSPDVYAWARGACALAAGTPPGCAALGVPRWVELAAHNGWPWLALAAEAERAGDRAALDAALHHASQATDWSTSRRRYLQVALASLPADAGTPQRLAALAEAIRPADLASPLVLPSRAACDASQPADRREACARVAERMLARADDLLVRGIAVAMGDGWPEARVTALRQAGNATLQALELPRGDRPLVCRAIDRRNAMWLRAVEIGELAAIAEFSGRER